MTRRATVGGGFATISVATADQRGVANISSGWISVLLHASKQTHSEPHARRQRTLPSSGNYAVPADPASSRCTFPIYKPFSSVWIKLLSAAKPHFGIIVAFSNSSEAAAASEHLSAITPSRLDNEAECSLLGGGGAADPNGDGNNPHRPCPVSTQQIQTLTGLRAARRPAAVKVSASALPSHNLLWA